MRMIKSDAPQLNISRRAFLYGAGAVAAGAALSSLGCQSGSDDASSYAQAPADAAHVSATEVDNALKLANVDTIETQLGDVAVLSVASDCVFTTEDCKFVKKASNAAKRVTRAHLPYGSLLWANDDNIAACLLPCDTSKPLTKIALLALSTGDLHTVRESAISEKEGFHIYDVRANSQGAVWLEADILNGRWRIYTAEVLSGGKKLGKAQLAEEGDGEWETPSLAVAGDYAFWQLVPSPNTSKEKSELVSLLMRVRFGGSKEDVKCVYEAPGRMACAPTPAENGIAIAPRAKLENGSGTYYQLTYIDGDSGVVESALALPSSMKPNYVAYGPTGFSFAFESIYNYGDGISNLGTYVASGKDSPVYAAYSIAGNAGAGDAGAGAAGVTEGAVTTQAALDGSSADAESIKPGESFGEWFRFPRSPFTSPAWMGNWFMVKSTSVVAGIDLARRRYFSIEPEFALQGYGEYLASEGPTDKVVTFSNIDYTPIGGDHIRECNVRVWEVA